MISRKDPKGERDKGGIVFNPYGNQHRPGHDMYIEIANGILLHTVRLLRILNDAKDYWGYEFLIQTIALNKVNNTLQHCRWHFKYTSMEYFVYFDLNFIVCMYVTGGPNDDPLPPKPITLKNDGQVRDHSPVPQVLNQLIPWNMIQNPVLHI